MILAIYLCANDKRGISAVQLANLLEISYESAWYLLVRIRRAMGQQDQNYILTGIVEMDDLFVSGSTHGGKRGRGTEKAKVVLSLSKTEKGFPLFARMKEIKDLKTSTLQSFTDTFLKKGTRVECDSYKSYRNLQGVDCATKNFEVSDGDLMWLHRTIDNLKAFLLGTHHGRCMNLQSYLDEFCFRFNRRHNKDELFFRLARAIASSSRLAELNQ